MKDKKVVIIVVIVFFALLLCFGGVTALFLVMRSRSEDVSDNMTTEQEEISKAEEDSIDNEDDEDGSFDSPGSEETGEEEEDVDIEDESSDPSFANARNASREADLLAIRTALLMYWSYTGTSIDTIFDIPDCSSASGFIGTDAGNVDLGSILVDEYLIAMPTDPLEGDEGNTGYTICKTTDGKIRLEAPHAEGKMISREV